MLLQRLSQNTRKKKMIKFNLTGLVDMLNVNAKKTIKKILE